MSRSSVCNAVFDVCKGLVEVMGGCIRLPQSIDEARVVAAEFQEFGEYGNRARGAAGTPGLPQVVGAIDGTHAPLLFKPPASGDAFIDHSSQLSFNVQAVCDSKLLFSDGMLGARAGRMIQACWRAVHLGARSLIPSPLCASFLMGGAPLWMVFVCHKC